MTSNWSGYPNGGIPLSKGVEFENTGKYLQADAAASLSRIFDAVAKDTGQRPYIAANEDLYRDLDEQVALLHANYHTVTYATGLVYAGHNWAKNTTPGTVICAEPGYSNHGTMIAADITFNAATQASFRKHCAAEQWTNAGDGFGESWHKEYHGPMTTPSGGGTPIPTEEQDDDMPKLVRIGSDDFLIAVGYIYKSPSEIATNAIKDQYSLPATSPQKNGDTMNLACRPLGIPDGKYLALAPDQAWMKGVGIFTPSAPSEK